MSKKYLSISIAILALLVIGGVGYAYFSHSHTKPQDAYLPKAESAGSTTPPTSGASQPALSKEKAEQSKQPTSITPSSTPTSSDSGVITITSPKQGDTVISGSQVSGSSSSKQVYFLLKGSKSGQLSSGSSQTVNGVFSFELGFTNQVSGGSDTGVLEVYTLDSNGAEQDNASIAVNISG